MVERTYGLKRINKFHRRESHYEKIPCALSNRRDFGVRVRNTIEIPSNPPWTIPSGTVCELEISSSSKMRGKSEGIRNCNERISLRAFWLVM